MTHQHHPYDDDPTPLSRCRTAAICCACVVVALVVWGGILAATS